MTLPPLPELPSSPQERLRWIAWGEACFRAGMERAAQAGEQYMLTQYGNHYGIAAAIRGEAERKDEHERM